jgi:hypothetical protein
MITQHDTPSTDETLIELAPDGAGRLVRFVQWGFPTRNVPPNALVQPLEGGPATWADPGLLFRHPAPADALPLLPLLVFALRLALPGRTYWAALDLEQQGDLLRDCGHRHATRKWATLCAIERGPTVAVILWGKTRLESFSDAETAAWLHERAADPLIARMGRAWSAQRLIEVTNTSMRFRDGSTIGEKTEAPEHGTMASRREHPRTTDEDHADPGRVADRERPPSER